MKYTLSGAFKKILHPGNMFVFLWIFYFSIRLLGFFRENINLNIAMYILISIFCFYLGTIIISIFPRIKMNKIYIFKFPLKIFYRIILIGFFYELFWRLNIIINNIKYNVFDFKALKVFSFEKSVDIPLIISILSILRIPFFIVSVKLYFEKGNTYYILTPFFLTILFAFTTGGRATALFYIICLIVIYLFYYIKYKRNLSIKIIIIFIIISLLFVYVMGFLVGTQSAYGSDGLINNLTSFWYYRIVGNIVALEKIYPLKQNNFPSGTLYPILYDLNKLNMFDYNLNFEKNNLTIDQFVDIGVMFNTYSIFRFFWEDYGVIGSFGAFFIFGFISKLAYKKALKKGDMWIGIYSFIYATLIFSYSTFMLNRLIFFRGILICFILSFIKFE